MSTQDAESGIPVSVLPEADLQHVRLLELPAELLALVTSEKPPTLYLKSKEDPDGKSKDVNVVLCTPDKTYNIRQVSTSNSVYLTEPKETPDEGGGLPQIGIEAIVKCDSTLELIPAPVQSAIPYIKSTLPVYTSTGTYTSQKTVAKADLFSHIPLSQAECERGWLELACFESTNPRGAFIPSAKVRVEVWQRAFTAAVAEGANLSDAFVADDLPSFALDLREDWPFELLSGIFATVSTSSPGGNLAIDGDRCTRFVGLSQLEARSGGREIDTTDFLSAWKKSLPDDWHAKCELSILQGSYELHGAGASITYIDTLTSTGATTATDTKSTVSAKRKWHDKFRPSKKS